MIKQIIIKTNNEKSMYKVLDKVHNQLKGNQDYIDCNIVLNDSSSRNDDTENEVHVYIMKEIRNRPEIIL